MSLEERRKAYLSVVNGLVNAQKDLAAKRKGKLLNGKPKA